ncbi:hypothetical protein L208DRAFT_1420030 [Tricholoma matsutake]|nr:hypothetical protein L208DRAFT_1420030 [Tricholoma matsutake 945]
MTRIVSVGLILLALMPAILATGESASKSTSQHMFWNVPQGEAPVCCCGGNPGSKVIPSLHVCITVTDCTRCCADVFKLVMTPYEGHRENKKLEQLTAAQRNTEGFNTHEDC